MDITEEIQSILDILSVEEKEILQSKLETLDTGSSNKIINYIEKVKRRKDKQFHNANILYLDDVYKSDAQVKEINGVDEILLNAKGVFKMIVINEKVESTEKGNIVLEEICKKIAMHGYGKGIQEIKTFLLKADKIPLNKWFDSVWNTYINDNDIIEIMGRFNNFRHI